jgi:hypothetical protein
MGDALSEFARAAAALDGVVRTSIGPHGAQKIVTSATGRVLVTKNGSAMLNALSAESPPMRVLLDAARAHGAARGDGTISFVVMLAEALRRIDACVRARSLGEPSRVRLVRALSQVALRWLPDEALPLLRREAEADAVGPASAACPPAPASADGGAREAARAIAASTLRGQFSEAMCAVLGRMVADSWARCGGCAGLAPAELPVFGVAGAPLDR